MFFCFLGYRLWAVDMSVLARRTFYDKMFRTHMMRRWYKDANMLPYAESPDHKLYSSNYKRVSHVDFSRLSTADISRPEFRILQLDDFVKAALWLRKIHFPLGNVPTGCKTLKFSHGNLITKDGEQVCSVFGVLMFFKYACIIFSIFSFFSVLRILQL